MSGPHGLRTYRKGAHYQVKIDGHPEMVSMASIETEAFVTGRGVILVMDRGDGFMEHLLDLLNRNATQLPPEQSSLWVEQTP